MPYYSESFGLESPPYPNRLGCSEASPSFPIRLDLSNLRTENHTAPSITTRL